MDVRVALQWSDGEPGLAVSEGDEGVTAIVDPRLSDHQVKAACAQLDGVGDAVFRQWQGLVGLTAEEGSAR